MRRYVAGTAVAGAILILSGGCRRAAANDWMLTNISGNLPDLKFSLATAGNSPLSAADFRGSVVLLYFGYLHCPDVCPMTMARLAGVVHRLGDKAPKVRILFVSVDPRRDTPAAVAAYAHAFTPAAVGATGDAAQIEELAKRYRVAYQAETPDTNGSYEVMHSKAVYVFDSAGKARLLISDTDSPEAIVHDLRELVRR